MAGKSRARAWPARISPVTRPTNGSRSAARAGPSGSTAPMIAGRTHCGSELSDHGPAEVVSAMESQSERDDPARIVSPVYQELHRHEPAGDADRGCLPALDRPLLPAPFFRGDQPVSRSRLAQASSCLISTSPTVADRRWQSLASNLPRSPRLQRPGRGRSASDRLESRRDRSRPVGAAVRRALRAGTGGGRPPGRARAGPGRH